MFQKLLRKIETRRQMPLRREKITRAIQVGLEPLEGRTLMSFSPAVIYPAATAPVAMTSGDFNHDGQADVVTSNGLTGSATVLLGNGDGTFGAAHSSPIGSTPGSSYTGSQAGTLTTGDFNGDGNLDVAVITSTNAAVLMGNGDGTFGAATLTPLGSSPSRLSSADVNGDGKDDLVTANTAGYVSVSISNGNGTFARTDYAANTSPQDVKTVDLNHDGKPDLVVANALSAGTVSVLMGNGDGTYQASKSYPAFSAPYRITVADFNGDGNEDVAVANSYTSSCVTILYGNGDGTLGTYHSYDTGSQPWELRAGDVDGDGKPDLISSNGSTYQIELNNGDGTMSPTTNVAGGGLIFAADDFNHDGTIDVAGASAGNVGVLINNAAATTNVSTAVAFKVSAPSTTAAGAQIPLTITAVDVNGNTVGDFQGTVHVTGTDTRFAAQTYTFLATDAGTRTLTVGTAMFKVGSQTITVNGPSLLTGSAAVTVVAGAPARFIVAAPASTTAGSPSTLTVTAQDNYGNLASGYTGTVHLTSSDTQAVLPADYTFTADENGSHTFTATLKTAGLTTVAATDTLTATTLGRSNGIVVTPSVAVSLGLVGGGGHIGSAKAVTVKAFDVFGNVATGYNGVVHLSASDAKMVLPADGALVNGVGTFNVIPMTLGAQTITATDLSIGITGTETVLGTPGDASRFVVSKLTGGVAGSTQAMTITAYDAFGNLAVDYSGTLVVSSTDTNATLPNFYTFTAADTGSHTFTVVMRTAGTQSVTMSDWANPGISSTQTGIVVTPAAASTILVPALHSTVAGVAQSITITARDVYGNIAAGYAGTLSFSSSDTLAALPANYKFTATDAGSHTFSIALKSSGGQTFAVNDTVAAAMSFSQRDLLVTAAAMTGFSFKAPTNATAGTAFAVTVSAVDTFGNTISGYVGKVHFTGPSGSGNVLPIDYTFTAADAGSHVFSITLSSTGTQSLYVADSATASLKGSVQVSVKAATSTGGGTTIGGGTGGTGGGGKKVV